MLRRLPNVRPPVLGSAETIPHGVPLSGELQTCLALPRDRSATARRRRLLHFPIQSPGNRAPLCLTQGHHRRPKRSSAGHSPVPRGYGACMNVRTFSSPAARPENDADRFPSAPAPSVRTASPHCKVPTSDTPSLRVERGTDTSKSPFGVPGRVVPKTGRDSISQARPLPTRCRSVSATIHCVAVRQDTLPWSKNREKNRFLPAKLQNSRKFPPALRGSRFLPLIQSLELKAIPYNRLHSSSLRLTFPAH